MRSLILQMVARGALPIATLFALFLLVRGHDDPGGGFIAGLVTAAAIVLEALGFGAARTRERLGQILRLAPWVGLLLAILAGFMAWGQPYMTHLHGDLPVLGGGEAVHVSSTLVFDLGVYFTVVGVTTTLIATFARETR